MIRAEDAPPAGDPSALRAIVAIVRKDLRLQFRRVESLGTMIAFAVLIVVVFAFAGDPTPADFEHLGPGALWVSVLFAGAIGFGRWFAEEERNAALQGMLLTPVDRGALFLGKWIGATVFLLALELVLVPVAVVLYGLDFSGAWISLVVLLVVVTAGYTALGTFFAAVAAKTTAGELILPVLLFPLAVPLVLAGAEGGQALVTGEIADYRDWLGLAIAFVVIFGTVCTLAFEYAIEE